jgi:hypothetical protein
MMRQLSGRRSNHPKGTRGNASLEKGCPTLADDKRHLTPRVQPPQQPKKMVPRPSSPRSTDYGQPWTSPLHATWLPTHGK